MSQGVLQAIFEYQTAICELTGMEVANASMYDGSTGAAEAVMMAVRLTGRRSVVVARSLHPEYREVLATYATHQGIPLATVGFADNGRMNLKELEQSITPETACVLIQSPNFFGTIEDVDVIAEIAHKHGAMLVVSIAEAVSLGIVEPPRQADIIAMEAQSFGVPLGFGGPYCGVIATREKYVRQMPGRLVGQTVDKQGKRGFVLTLATREQHIRRAKATSNICTNQGLLMTAATIYMSLMGPQGLARTAAAAHARTRELTTALSRLPGVRLAFPGPYFHEAVLTLDRPVAPVLRTLAARGIIGGLDLSAYFPELGNALLVCATETKTLADIERYRAQLADAMQAARAA